MDNRVYYGQYSLKHWIDLILKKNIVLPDYQRYFVWNEEKVKTLIDTLKKKQFVPPITIGAFRADGGANQNLILDGQQRLTSILLAYIGLYPDEATFKATKSRMLASENDDEDDDDEELDNILKWNFNSLTGKGNNKLEILEKIIEGNYKLINLSIDEDFLKTTFLGFSYLVPRTENQLDQQKYYSSVFRNINIQGESLLPQESRASLYYLNNNFVGFFDPEFIKRLSIKSSSNESSADIVRYLALLSQYAKDENSNRLARGYKPKMEKYYEEYIYSVVGESASSLFKDFTQIFPDNNYEPRFTRLKEAIYSLEIPIQYTSIIDIDVYLFGLIYFIVFKNRVIDIARKDLLKQKIDDRISAYKADWNHRRAPGALKYLRQRITDSIQIYREYSHEQA